jgi:hypothetical protein
LKLRQTRAANAFVHDMDYTQHDMLNAFVRETSKQVARLDARRGRKL